MANLLLQGQTLIFFLTQKRKAYIYAVHHVLHITVCNKRNNKIQKSNNSKKKKHIKRRPHIKPEMNSLHERGKEL